MPKTKESIADVVKRVLIEQLGVDAEEVTPAAKLVDDLGADELERIEIQMALEDALEIEIPDEESDGWKTVGDIVQSLEKKQL